MSECFQCALDVSVGRRQAMDFTPWWCQLVSFARVSKKGYRWFSAHHDQVTGSLQNFFSLFAKIRQPHCVWSAGSVRSPHKGAEIKCPVATAIRSAHSSSSSVRVILKNHRLRAEDSALPRRPRRLNRRRPATSVRWFRLQSGLVVSFQAVRRQDKTCHLPGAGAAHCESAIGSNPTAPVKLRPTETGHATLYIRR